MATEQPQQQKDLALKFIEQVRAEPVWFAEQVLNHRALPGEPSLKDDPVKSWELDDFQRDLLEACADVWRVKQGQKPRVNLHGRNYLTVRSGHGPGKTHTAALIALWFNTAFPGRVVCVAPKLAQLRTRVWAALRKINARAEPWYRATHVIHDTSVYWKGVDSRTGKLVEDRNWCILAETASQPENLAGHHHLHQLVLVEEATGVKEHLWPVVFGALSTGELQILLMISNPSTNQGTFANSHLKSSEEKNYFRYHVSLKNARRIDRPWVEAMTRKYGADSPVCRVRCLGEFSDSSPLQLIAMQWVLDARLTDVPQDDGSLPRLRVSVDVADGGTNETVVTAAHHFASKVRMLKQKRHNFPSSESPVLAANAAARMFNDWSGNAENGDTIVVDAMGVGAGTAGTLIMDGYPVVQYRGGATSDNPKLWRNRRVQSYLALRNAFRDGKIELSADLFDDETDWDDLMAQLCSIEMNPTGERVEDLLTKEEMTRRGIVSPDMADSLAMQYATQSPAVAGTTFRVPVVRRSTLLEGL